MLSPKTTTLLLAAGLLLTFGVPPTGAQGAETNVTIRDNAFEPPAVVITPGTTVVWHNEGTQVHTVTLTIGSTGDAFDTAIPPGGSFSHTFAGAGVVLYHCTPHQGPLDGNMRGLVVV